MCAPQNPIHLLSLNYSNAIVPYQPIPMLCTLPRSDAWSWFVQLYPVLCTCLNAFENSFFNSGQMPDLGFGALLAKFAAEARLDGVYFFCNQDQLLEVANIIDKVSSDAGWRV